MLIVWLALLLVASCKKKDDPQLSLPPETQEGKNTFGCMLNGKLWRNTADQPGFRALYAQVQGGGWVDIYAWYRNGTDRTERFVFISDSLYREGTYDLANPAHKTGIIYRYFENNTVVASGDTTLLEKSGSLTITKFDLSRRIIAGRFSFKMKKKNGVSFEATDGRFDISF